MSKRLIPLFITILLLLGFSLPTAVTSTVVPPSPTPALQTDTPAAGSSSSAVSAAPATDTPAAGASSSASSSASHSGSLSSGQPPVATAQPPSGAPIAHLPAGQDIKITFIKMLDAGNGWGIGGLNGNSDHVFRTADGGLTWKDLTPAEPTPANPQTPKKAIGFFMDAQKAWVAFYGSDTTPPSQDYVWYTTDGGATWNYSGLTEPALYSESYVPTDLSFADAQHGWMMAHVGAGMNHDYYALLATTDGGATWKTLISPQGDNSGTQGCYKSGLVFDSTQAGWMTVDCHGVVAIPYFFKTQDGGAAWTSVNLPAPSSAPNMFNSNQSACDMTPATFLSATGVDLVLDCSDFTTNPSTKQSFLYETTDGGSSWNTYAYPGGPLQFIGTQTAFALGHNIQRSADGGHTWTAVKTVQWDGQFSFLDANTAWAVATNSGQIALVKTTNGAVTWQEIKPKVGP